MSINCHSHWEVCVSASVCVGVCAAMGNIDLGCTFSWGIEKLFKWNVRFIIYARFMECSRNAPLAAILAPFPISHLASPSLSPFQCKHRLNRSLWLICTCMHGVSACVCVCWLSVLIAFSQLRLMQHSLRFAASLQQKAPIVCARQFIVNIVTYVIVTEELILR